MSEWAMANLAPGTYRTHVRLGQARGSPRPGQTPAEHRALMLMTLPEADLVALNGKVATIVEFIVWRPHEAIGQILFYRSLLPATPGYEDVLPENVTLKIVSGLEDLTFRTFANSLGISFEVYRPEWLSSALAARRGRS